MPMTGAERVATHRQRQVDRIAELERELAELKTVSNVDPTPTIDDFGNKVYSVDVVARVAGVTKATVRRAVKGGTSSASRHNGQLVFGAGDVTIWRRRAGMTYLELMERALDIASGLH